jgi:hypothetical protein
MSEAGKRQDGQMGRWAWIYDPLMALMTLGKEGRLRQGTVELARLKPGDNVLEVGCGPELAAVLVPALHDRHPRRVATLAAGRLTLAATLTATLAYLGLTNLGQLRTGLGRTWDRGPGLLVAADDRAGHGLAADDVHSALDPAPSPAASLQHSGGHLGLVL